MFFDAIVLMFGDGGVVTRQQQPVWRRFKRVDLKVARAKLAGCQDASRYLDNPPA